MVEVRKGEKVKIVFFCVQSCHRPSRQKLQQYSVAYSIL